MSRGNGSGSGGGVRSARLELQLNLSPPAPAGMEVDGHDDSDSSSPISCVSSDGRSSSGSGSSPAGKSPMVIGACTRCLMYCMVAKKDYPTCINCKQPCLVDLLHGEAGGSVDDDKKRGKRK
ncbi:protein GL2-INTERACTING REPRESSOR 1-like [Phragmites australis]|uniref:protein GL2-INTERACTING REPRESSOR 1-like n=1 Tax=Phragmites australis TaxID=29695 RepID=UPI002D798A8D|nr:protein GL2-INTERACTING REPRESSOR 1-like [Phragmites australis]